MPNTPFAIVLVVASTFAFLAATPCRASNPGVAPKSGTPAKSSVSKRLAMRDLQKANAAKARRNDREAPPRILTYNLFQDPVFKLNGALADKRQLLAPPAFERHGHSHAVHAVPVVKATGKHSDAPALKLQEPESAGIDFSCRDKPFRGSASPRELTACYKHNVDRSWKTQTYLSREYTEGSQKWGGGLAVRYAY